MSITLSHEMFTSLSKSCRDEILEAFMNAAVQTIKQRLIEPEATVNEPVAIEAQDVVPMTAFESASLSFGGPLILPDYKLACNVEQIEPVAVTEPIPQKRVAKSYPVAYPNDLYTVAPLKDIQSICNEIDNGLFISNVKSADWSKGGRYHHMNWDVKRVFMAVKYLQQATSIQINKALPTMPRYRVSSILRELRKQGLLIVS